MEQNCVNCKNAIEENSVYRCTLAKVPKYEKGDYGLSLPGEPPMLLLARQFEA